MTTVLDAHRPTARRRRRAVAELRPAAASCWLRRGRRAWPSPAWSWRSSTSRTAVEVVRPVARRAVGRWPARSWPCAGRRDRLAPIVAGRRRRRRRRHAGGGRRRPWHRSPAAAACGRGPGRAPQRGRAAGRSPSTSCSACPTGAWRRRPPPAGRRRLRRRRSPPAWRCWPTAPAGRRGRSCCCGWWRSAVGPAGVARPVRGRRRRRPAPHAVVRLGRRGRRRGGARRRRPARCWPTGPTSPPPSRSPSPACVPIALVAGTLPRDGGAGRPPAHPHRRARRADRAGRRRSTSSSCSASGARRPAASGRSCCCRWSPPAWPRCSTCRPGAGSPSGPTASSTASGSRPTRRCARSVSASPASIPMDELLLQLAESLRKSMALAAAEVWTGSDGRYELAAGVPHREPPPLEVGAKELPRRRPGRRQRRHVARHLAAGARRARRLGGAAGRARRPRAASCSASSSLRRRPDGEPFTEDEDRVLTELARQVGLALHNVQLDTALQASLDELRLRNDELQQSRARIVAAGDAERRKLERNLHDGAQQHLVALAVKLRLAGDAVDDDPDDAKAMIDELRATCRRPSPSCARSPTASSRRCSCRSGLGGGAARPPPAGRRCPTTVEVDGVGRYSGEIEAAVYFCCSRRCRTRASTPATAASATCAGVARTTARCASRWPTTAPASTRRRRRGRGPRLRQHGRPPGCLRRHPHGELRARRGDDGERITAGVTSRRRGQAQAGSPPDSHRRRTIRGESSSLLT